MTISADRLRSLTGLALAAGLVAGLLGIAACLEVPVGDPEQSRVDARFDGAWFDDEDGNLWFFRPWDVRTWLMTQAETGRDEAACRAEVEGTGSGDTEAPQAAGSNQDAARGAICTVTIFKAWLTTLGGRAFLVLEPAAVAPPALPRAADFPFENYNWYAFRIDWLDADSLRLRVVTAEIEDLDKVKSREEAERIIAANADNPALYGQKPAAAGDETQKPTGIVLRRASPEADGNIQRLLWLFFKN